MNLKKKIVTIGCAAALASMMAVPAFAANTATDNPVDNATSGAAPLGANMDINASVSNSTNILSVTVPTAIPVGIQTVATGETNQGAFASFIAPADMTISNHSYTTTDGKPFKITTEIETVKDEMNLLADVNLYIGTGTQGDSIGKVKLDTAASKTKLVDVDAGTGLKSDPDGITAGTATINVFAETAHTPVTDALTILSKITSGTSVAAPVQTMVYVTKATI